MPGRAATAWVRCYTRAQIDAALAPGGTPLAHRDAVGHGTTTTGIAGGNGRNSPSGKYRGVAPNATFLIVKVTSDGAPAHDGQPAEAPYYDAARIPVAIQFVKDQKTALNMPAVMLLNLGSTGGPTDGTSTIARKIDEVVGPGKPGIVFVTGPGDDGNIENRASGTVTQGGNAAIQFQKGSTGTLVFDLWYPDTDQFAVTLTTPAGTFGPFPAPASNNAAADQAGTGFAMYHRGSSQVFFGALNNKKELFIQFTGVPGTYTVTLTGTVVAATGRFDATLNPSRFVTPAYAGNKFLTFAAPGNVWDGATALYNISPNAYVGRTTWTDIDGINRSSILAHGLPGEIWKGSSVGPTFDGRLGVDLSAPGHQLATSYSATSYWATFRGNLVQDGGGLYGMAGAVSAAAPMVTGVIALMLEMNPTLDADQVRTLLRQSSRADGQTGPVPNTTWGYGKLDALAALDAVCQFGPSAFCSSLGPNLVQNGDFSAGMSNWNVFEEPDIVHNSAAGGVFEFHRANPTTTPLGQATVYQQTGQPVAAAAALTAQFDIGNSDPVRKRISVLVLNADFSDLSVCTFYLLPNAPIRTYRMRTHPTQAWSNAAIYFYAANGGTSGGNYQVDNVSLRVDPAASTTRTDCVDPVAPAAVANLAPSASLLTNGNFGTGSVVPWDTPYDITWQINGGVFEFIRPGTPNVPAGVVLQHTFQAVPANQLMTAAFKLGNSSGVRKRVTVLLHDFDFSDLSACTFWLPPGQELRSYTMRSYATEAWSDATLSVYAASTGLDQWMRLDDAAMYKTPATSMVGTECVEPLPDVIAASIPSDDPVAALSATTGDGLAMTAQGWTLETTTAGATAASGATTWQAEASTTGTRLLSLSDPVDLRQAASARLIFKSWLTASASTAAVQASTDGVTWQTIAVAPASTDWVLLGVDLDAVAGGMVYLRFALETGEAVNALSPDAWRVADVRVEIGAPRAALPRASSPWPAAMRSPAEARISRRR